MSKKVLLFGGDRIPLGPPAPGNEAGLRICQIAQGLRERGFAVAISLSRSACGRQAQQLPAALQHLIHEPTEGSQRGIIDRVKPDVIVVCGWRNWHITCGSPVPLAIDLCALGLPRPTTDRRAKKAAADALRKIDVLQQASYFTCAEDAQRDYFSGWILQAGILPGRHTLQTISLSRSSSVPGETDRCGGDAPTPGQQRAIPQKSIEPLAQFCAHPGEPERLFPRCPPASNQAKGASPVRIIRPARLAQNGVLKKSPARAKKVLVFSCDMTPEHGLPTSGGGLRAWSVCEGLRSRGFEVVCSVPSNGMTYLATKHWADVPAALKQHAWNWTNQEAVIEAVRPDVVVYSSNANHVGLDRKNPVPTAFDLHGPYMLEAHYMRGQTTEIDWQNCYRRLAIADFFFAAGHKQQKFFWSWLRRSGFDLHERLIDVIPVSLSPQLPLVQKKVSNEPTFVFGGGFFPWTDPTQALLTLVEMLEQRGRGRLWSFTDNHALRTSQEQFQEVSKRLLHSDRVVFPGLRPREDLLATYAQADVAIDLMKWNPERELAVTTRTVEYLWCGLPVIYNDYAELSPYIKQYHAGWCIDPDDDHALRRTIDDILSHPEMLPELARNAQRLVREHFTWEKTIDPLADFCADPHRCTTKQLRSLRDVRLAVPRYWRSFRFHLRTSGVRGVCRKAASILLQKQRKAYT